MKYYIRIKQELAPSIKEHIIEAKNNIDLIEQIYELRYKLFCYDDSFTIECFNLDGQWVEKNKNKGEKYED